MPLFIQSLPLSFKTFWRYFLLLPFLAIFALLFSFLSVLPIVGLLVPGIVSAGLTLIGLRCALAAHGLGNRLDTGKLLKISAIYCVIYLVVDVGLSAIHSVMWWGIVQSGIEVEPIGLFVGLLGASPYWSGVLVTLLSPSAIVAAAFAVPMTAAAFSATPRGGDVSFFFGLGSGLSSLLIVMLVWLFGGHMFAIVGEIWTALGLIVVALNDWAQSEDLSWELTPSRRNAVGSLLIMTWASSWFFATAALAWIRTVEQRSSLKPSSDSVSSDDIRALRQSRM